MRPLTAGRTRGSSSHRAPGAPRETSLAGNSGCGLLQGRPKMEGRGKEVSGGVEFSRNRKGKW